jgi:orotidine-5'-phosphate decarboxylase
MATTSGVMKIEARERLILALDFPNDPENPDRLIESYDATRLVDHLGDLVSVVKIGWALYMAGGQDLIEPFVAKGKHVFLDLKFGDIGESVKRLVLVAARLGVSFITVNTSFDTVRAAVRAKGSSDLKILTVTLLTSLNEEDLRELGIPTSVPELVRYKARGAKDAGCDGVIASGREAALIREEVGGGFLVVTPGIRPTGAPHEDHKRAVTPAEAIGAGADYLVIGRPITKAPDPRAAAETILREMQGAFDLRQAAR